MEQWYFAYGSNLHIGQMEARTGRIRRVLRTRLKGYRFAFNNHDENGQIYANIVVDTDAEVWGVVYLCDSDALRKWMTWIRDLSYTLRRS